MDPDVTGPPAKMAERRDDLTPMMSQYHDLCAEYEDALVLFQVGDFYEAFCEAAAETARVCEVTLTQREDSTGSYRMAGVPVEDAPAYVEDLLAAGYRVAVADQVEDPDEVSGVVERAVTRVVTPGTVTDDELLSTGATYLGALARDPDRGRAGDAAWGVAFLEVTTGELLLTRGRRATVASELARVDPAELLVGPAVSDPPDDGVGATRVDADPGGFEADRARERLADRLDAGDAPVDPTDTPRSTGTGTDPESLSTAEARAVGGLLAYAEYTQGGDDAGALRVDRYDPEGYVRLDAAALGSLEVFDTRAGDGPTLVDVIDETASAPGRRRLEAWLRHPLAEADRVRRRHDAVEALTGAPLARADLREALAEVYDLERLATRARRGRADARDLRALADTLARVPDLRATLADLSGVDPDAAGGSDDAADGGLLAALLERLDPLTALRERVDAALVDDPPAEITEGGVIREGYDEDLDELRATERAGREWVADLEARERERTGIDSLSVGFTEVHGYYVEVTDPNLDRVPDDYTRRQTLKNSERFYTPELKRREDEILGASERADAREHRLFRQLRATVADRAPDVLALADAVADLDALVSLATVAVDREYVRPTVGADDLVIEGGRHPVVETTVEFVPNDLRLVEDDLAVITGPNMSGKSTYMRQAALVAVLAQAGGFVPADRARLPVFDAVYTRVGASDDIAGGRSTFMIEMAELTTILRAATADSLVILDEVGRGTATVDGLSIAWAATEHLHDEVGATALFATHYHELTAVADDLDRVGRLHFAADPDDDGVTFRYDVREGAADSSYGVEIARMAGVPDAVVERSRDLVERGGPGAAPAAGDPAKADARATGATGTDPSDAGGTDTSATEAPGTDAHGTRTAGTDRPDDGPNAGALDPAVESLLDGLRDLDLATTTPVEALNRLADLRERARRVEATAAGRRPDGGATDRPGRDRPAGAGSTSRDASDSGPADGGDRE
jgi:DNA mismatch repair protein MutS